MVHKDCQVFLVDKNGHIPVNLLGIKFVMHNNVPLEVHISADFSWTDEEEENEEGVLTEETADIVIDPIEDLDAMAQLEQSCPCGSADEEIPFEPKEKVEEQDCVQLQPFLQYA